MFAKLAHITIERNIVLRQSFLYIFLEELIGSDCQAIQCGVAHQLGGDLLRMWNRNRSTRPTSGLYRYVEGAFARLR